MAKKSKRKFEEELDKLFSIRTHKLRSQYWVARGATPRLTKTKVRDSILRLQEIAEQQTLSSHNVRAILASYDHKKQWHPKRGKGWSRADKKKAFKEWYEKNITTLNCVYAFWKKRDCLYVGRTLNGKGRPSSHFEKHWFNKATRIDIYGFDRKRDVPRFECLLTHKYEPAFSKIRPAQKKYYSNCPVCEGNALVDKEVKYIFRMR